MNGSSRNLPVDAGYDGQLASMLLFPTGLFVAAASALHDPGLFLAILAAGHWLKAPGLMWLPAGSDLPLLRHRTHVGVALRSTIIDNPAAR